MDVVRVTGAAHQTFARDEIERVRRQLRRSPAPQGAFPLCSAPSTTLVLNADGDVFACEATSQPLAKRKAQDLLRAFRGPTATTLRTGLAAGELPAEHCAACLRCLRLDLVAQSAILRDHADEIGSAEAVAPRRLVVRLDRGARGKDAIALLRRITSVLDGLDKLELCADDASTDPAIEPICAMLEARLAPLAVTLRTRTLSDPQVLRGALRTLRLAHLVLGAAIDLEHATTALRPSLADGATVTVRFVLAPDNWFELAPVATRAAALGARLDLRGAESDGRTPLLEASLHEQHFVIGVLGSLWFLFGNERRPASIFQDGYGRLRSELRRLVEDHARGTGEADAMALLAGREPLCFPPPGHALWVEQACADALLGWSAGLESAPGLARWSEDLLARDDAHALLAEHAWARLLLQKCALLAPTREAFAALLDVYGDASRRKPLLDDDRATATRAGIASACAHWRDWLGLDRLANRRRPWRAASANKATTADGRPDVTVLIPSFGHESFVEECIRSALGQTHRWLVVHVVDDRSTDATAEHARAIRDPRLSVRVNEHNLGLGNSVLAALERVTTPFVALLNSDDFFHPERIARCRQVLLDDARAQLVTTDLALVDAAGGELTTENTSRLRDGRMIFDWVTWYEQARATTGEGEDLFADLLRQNFLATSSNLFCRTDWLRAQAPALTSLKYCLDWHVFLGAAREGTLRHVKEPLAAYRLHGANTVWFREGRRWRYFLEVNRVAAEALRDELATAKQGAGAVVRHVAAHVVANTETDGIALWLNSLVGGVELERLSETDPAVREALVALEERADRITRLGYAVRDLGAERLGSALANARRGHGLEVARILGEIVREDARGFRDALVWSHRDAERIERRRNELEAELNRLRQREREASEQLAHALERARVVLDRFRSVCLVDAAMADDPIHALEAGVQRAAQLLATQGEENKELMDRVRRADSAARREIESLRADLAKSARASEVAVATARTTIAELTTRLDEARRAVDVSRRDIAEHAAHSARVEARLADVQRDAAAQRATAERVVGELRAETTKLGEEARRLATLVQHATRERDATRSEATALAEAKHAVETARDRLAAEKQQALAELERNQADKRGVEKDLERVTADKRGVEAERDKVRGEKQRLETERNSVTADRDRIDAERKSAVARGSDLDGRLRRTDQELGEARRLLRESNAELDRLLKSPEWRIGYALWRKTPLFAKSRRLARATWRRTRESGVRGMMFFRRLFAGRKPATPVGGHREGLKIAAGSTAHFPVISHTFVYQELTAMHDMLGADVKVFYTENGDPNALHAAFQYLGANKEYLQPAWEVHKADFEHYKRTRPDRVESLLLELTKYSGIEREPLLKRFELMLAFTYARRHALWGADYLHTYFFYDQALCGLVSSWVNGIPRGLSTYADHMLKDWPLKVVPLHLRTADVIVATSRRIRDELIGIGGAEIAPRVIVKPNGTDGQRFRFVARTAPAGRTLELACVSRIEPKKGMIELAEAAKLLRDSGKTVRIHVIGAVDKGSASSEEYGERFERRIAELGVGDLVVRHGRMKQEELRPLLDAADVFVAPFVETESGDKDGIPTAILEAMATGLPIIGTDAGSISETFDDGVEGLRVPQRDPKALAHAITRLIEHPELAPKMGKRAKTRFDREFDIRIAEPRLHARILAAVDARKPAASPE